MEGRESQSVGARLRNETISLLGQTRCQRTAALTWFAMPEAMCGAGLGCVVEAAARCRPTPGDLAAAGVAMSPKVAPSVGAADCLTASAADAGCKA
eukprot:365535-Chlamydomonas_euryale.AAC.87